MERRMGLNYLIGWLVVALIGGSEGREYWVGDTFGWDTPTNQTFYSDWAASHNFLVGDILVFKWSGEHTVAYGSDPTYYNDCNTRGPGMVLGSSNLNETQFKLALSAGSSYYFCTIDDHCDRGQKFSINLHSSQSASATHPTTPFPILYALLLSYFLTQCSVFF